MRHDQGALIPNRVPTIQPTIRQRIRAGITQRLIIVGAGTPNEILWMVGINYILTDAEPGARAVFDFVDKLIQRIPKP